MANMRDDENNSNESGGKGGFSGTVGESIDTSVPQRTLMKGHTSNCSKGEHCYCIQTTLGYWNDVPPRCCGCLGAKPASKFNAEDLKKQEESKVLDYLEKLDRETFDQDDFRILLHVQPMETDPSFYKAVKYHYMTHKVTERQKRNVESIMRRAEERGIVNHNPENPPEIVLHADFSL